MKKSKRNLGLQEMGVEAEAFRNTAQMLELKARSKGDVRNAQVWDKVAAKYDTLRALYLDLVLAR